MPAHSMHEALRNLSRRRFLGGATLSLGAVGLGALLGMDGSHDASPAAPGRHFAAKAKRVIYLHQAGGPPQMELFDYKPGLTALKGQLLPDSVRDGQKFTGMSASQAPLIVPSVRPFKQYGRSGRWLSELIPGIGSIVDDICIIDSMNTEHINHAPAITFLQTGSPNPGRPSIGAWTSYGLGSVNENLPTFVVLTSVPAFTDCGQPLYEHLWGSGFLPSSHQGVKLRSSADPVMFLKNPDGVSRELRREMLDALAAVNAVHFKNVADPEINTRIAQYELAYRMQTSVPEFSDLSDEPDETFEMYGPYSRQAGSYARNCILARRLAERGVRFVQLYHTGWDFHGHIVHQIHEQVEHTDIASAALVKDLKRRGLLDDTLVIWGGEFGRGVTVQGDINNVDAYGRDHHGRCFTTWMAGAGVKAGISYGSTDDFSFNVTENPVHIHDLQATLLERLGFDHTRLTYRSQGRDFRLTDVHGKVVRGVLS